MGRNNSEDRLLTVPEVAQRLRVNPESVRRWLCQGKITGLLFGGTQAGYRIPESEIERFMANSIRKPSSKGEVA